jgi:hypothetical protein
MRHGVGVSHAALDCLDVFLLPITFASMKSAVSFLVVDEL